MSATWAVDGRDLLVHVEATGFNVRFVADDQSGRTGHLHLFVDRPPVDAGARIGFERGIVHSESRDIRVSDLGPGTHVIWVVVADGVDLAFDPLVATRIVVHIE